MDARQGWQGSERGQYQHCLVGFAPAAGADLEWPPLAKSWSSASISGARVRQISLVAFRPLGPIAAARADRRGEQAERQIDRDDPADLGELSRPHLIVGPSVRRRSAPAALGELALVLGSGRRRSRRQRGAHGSGHQAPGESLRERANVHGRPVGAHLVALRGLRRDRATEPDAVERHDVRGHQHVDVVAGVLQTDGDVRLDQQPVALRRAAAKVELDDARCSGPELTGPAGRKRRPK